MGGAPEPQDSRLSFNGDIGDHRPHSERRASRDFRMESSEPAGYEQRGRYPRDSVGLRRFQSPEDRLRFKLALARYLAGFVRRAEKWRVTRRRRDDH